MEIVLAAAGLLVALVASYFTWRTVPPKRQLTFTVRSSRLLNVHGGALGGSVEVLHVDSGPLRDPYIVWLTIRNSGRAAVASQHFDAGRPLRVRLAAPIIQILEPLNLEPPQSDPPQAQAKDDMALIGPGLLNRGQGVAYPLLVDGEPDIRVEHTLVDVEVRFETSVGFLSKPPPPATLAGAAVIYGLYAGVLGSLVVFGPSVSWWIYVALGFMVAVGLTGMALMLRFLEEPRA